MKFVPEFLSRWAEKSFGFSTKSAPERVSFDKKMFPNVKKLVTGEVEEKLHELQRICGITITTSEYYEQAIIHRSYIQTSGIPQLRSNERLEFLGDAILGHVVAEILFFLHTDVSEGQLTAMRSRIVSRQTLSEIAKKMNLRHCLMLNNSATKSLDSGADSILADFVEAIIAAIYLDHGYSAAKEFIVRCILSHVTTDELFVNKNYKNLLQELIQKDTAMIPQYEVMAIDGPEHDRCFTVSVIISDKIMGTGTGKNKKEAEQDAAKQALLVLQKK